MSMHFLPFTSLKFQGFRLNLVSLESIKSRKKRVTTDIALGYINKQIDIDIQLSIFQSLSIYIMTSLPQSVASGQLAASLNTLSAAWMLSRCGLVTRSDLRRLLHQSAS